MMPYNNPMNNLMDMMSKAGNNPEAFARNILAQNPDFAKMIQGQNPKTMAMNLMKQRGIDPQMFMRFFHHN